MKLQMVLLVKMAVYPLVYSLFLLAASIGLLACAGEPSPETVYRRISESELRPGEAIPVGQGMPILTVTGRVGTFNRGAAIEMDIDILEAAGIVEYTVLDPFQNREITYRGPLVSDLLALWQVPDDATMLDVLALNDYRATVPIKLVRDYPVIFAIQADGEYMPIEKRGPAMLVLPYDHFDFERPTSDRYWVWQIKSIEIR